MSGDWTDYANCATTDPELFFAEKGGATQPAKRICAMCPVKTECLNEALETNEEFGVWGGMSRHERELLTRVSRPGDAA